ncbi:CsbD family protein [Weissella sp. LMG 11983]|uniref:CsbD family protein n=1 Tax=Weissella sp. LMG 11983 TaxID=2987700 RepID=UPI0021F8A914|nr:CsbD family protein [Weissella sp. LMG 11983]MCW0927904.1 CsbD family protein [Weissella sp. LMG 11983]
MSIDDQVDKVAGKAKEFAGNATGDKHLEGEGKAQNLAGKAKEALGNLKDKAEGFVEEVKEKIDGDKS